MNKVVRYPHRQRRRPGRRLLTAVFLLCIGITTYFYIGQAWAYWQAQGELKRLAIRTEAIKQVNRDLQKEIILLQDEEYLELRARKELGLVQPGEIIFSVGD